MITNALASLAVNQIEAGTKWYAKLFGRAADATPTPEVAEWRFRDGGVLQIYELRERAGRGSVTLVVGDVDAQVRSLRDIGIDTDPPMESETTRVIMIKDLDGNSLAFAQPLKANRH